MDDGKKAVREFMLYIAAGFVVFIPLCCLGFLIARRFTLGVLFGALYGSAVMILYYYLFARAILKAAGGEPDAVKKRIQAAYTLRMFLLVILMGAGVYLSASLGVMHWLPLILSMLVPRLSIAVYHMIQRKKQGKDGDDVGN